MCEQKNAFWCSDRKSLCAVMHPCFVSGGNFCLKFRKKFVVEWLVFIANLNSQVGWYNYDFPQSFQKNSAMLLKTIHNSIPLYATYNSLHKNSGMLLKTIHNSIPLYATYNSLHKNSAMLLKTIYNSIPLYTTYNSFHKIISAFDAIELMHLIDCRSINWYSVIALNTPVIPGRETGVAR
jgi:hypothetical protein